MAGERLMHQDDAAASSLHPHEAEQNQLLSTSSDGSQVAAVADGSNHPSSLGTPSNQRLLFAPPMWSVPTVPYASVPFTSLGLHPPSITMFNPQIVPCLPMGSLYPRRGLNPFSLDPVNFQHFQMQHCSLVGADRFSGVSHNVGACFPGTNTHPYLDALSSQIVDRSFVNSASHLPSRLANNQSNASGLPGQSPSVGGFTYPSGNPGGSGSFVPSQPLGGWPLFNPNVGIREVNCIGSMSGLDSRNSPSAQEHFSFGGNIRTRANTVQGKYFEAQKQDNRQQEISSLPTTRMASNPGLTISPFVGAYRQEQPGHVVAASNGNEDVKESTGKTSTQRDVNISKHPGTPESKGDKPTHDTAPLRGRKRGRNSGTGTAAIHRVPVRMSRARNRSTSQPALDLSQCATSNASQDLAGSHLTSTPTACQSSPLSKPQPLVRLASASHPCFPPRQTASPQVSTSTAHAQSSAGPVFRPSKCQATASSRVGTASIPATSLSAPVKPALQIPSRALPSLVPSKTKTGPIFHIKHKEPPVTPKLSGYLCFFCKRDLSYAEEGPYTQPSPSPQVAVLSCGHSFHALCLHRITPDEEATNPPCIPCAVGEK